MQSSLAGIRQEAGLPERVATRIHLLLASVPDPEAAARYLEAPAAGIALRLRPHRQLAGSPALRRQSLFL